MTKSNKRILIKVTPNASNRNHMIVTMTAPKNRVMFFKHSDNPLAFWREEENGEDLSFMGLLSEEHLLLTLASEPEDHDCTTDERCKTSSTQHCAYTMLPRASTKKLQKAVQYVVADLITQVIVSELPESFTIEI